ncbi:MAG: SCO family protein [Simkania sp.]|nr:SCO family protein [Simkania sp.]
MITETESPALEEPTTSAPTPPTPADSGNVVHRIAYVVSGSPFFWVLIVGLLMSFPLIRAVLSGQSLVPPKRISQVPEFSFTNENGKTFGSKELRGKIWIGNFIFTSCSGVCPTLTQAMLDVRMKVKNLKGFIHLLSFSVDPEYDTPERLLEYAKNHHYDPKMWSFLTAPQEQIDPFIKDGLKLNLARPEDPLLVMEATAEDLQALKDNTVSESIRKALAVKSVHLMDAFEVQKEKQDWKLIIHGEDEDGDPEETQILISLNPNQKGNQLRFFPVHDMNIIDIAHTERMVLVDHAGYIRGYYRIINSETGQLDEQEFSRMMVDISLVANHY